MKESSSLNAIRTRVFFLPNTRELQVSTVEPSQQKNSPHVVFVGGWGSNLLTYQQPMEMLAQLGCTTYALVPPRKGKNSPASKSDIQGSEIEMNKAQAVTTVLDSLGQSVNDIDLVAHSEGGIVGTYAALLHAKTDQQPRIRSVTLITPAGLNGKDTAFGLAMRFISQGVKSAILRPDLYRKNKTAKAFASPFTAFHEVMAIANTDTLSLLQILHDEYGIAINVITGKHDPIFPSRRIAKRIGDTKFINFEELAIRHNGIQSQPQLVMEEVYRMISASQ